MSLKVLIQKCRKSPYRYSKEIREAAFAQDIVPEVMEILNELFCRIGFTDKASIIRVAQGLVSRLRMSGDLSAAEEYILKTLPSDTDRGARLEKTRIIRRALLEIIKYIEIEGVEWIEMVL